MNKNPIIEGVIKIFKKMYDSVYQIKHVSKKEYNDLLVKNIVYLNLYDAARNNPVIINKLQGIEDYLGKDYPLIYNEYENFSFDNFIKATNYLQQMNKDDLHINYFCNELLNLIG